MAVYRNATGVPWRLPFFSVLTGFLDMLTTNGIDVLDLCAPTDPTAPDRNGFGGHESWRRDVLLLKDGRPLAGVNMVAQQSNFHVLGGYVEPPVYGGDLAGAVGSLATGALDKLEEGLDTMRKSFSSRVEKEMPDAPKKEAKIPFTEMRWAILIRTPTLEPVVYEGGPFDLDKIDAAMNRLLDLLIEGSKQSASKPA